MAEGVLNWMYEQGELMFPDVAPFLLANGYSIIPQQWRGGIREPWIIDGRKLAYKRYIDTPPSWREVEWWGAQAGDANCAILCGPGSKGLGCIDIDVYDAKLAERIQACAAEMLGETPLQRVGNAPKIALFYRFEGIEKLRNTRWILAAETGEVPSEHMIELIFNGPVTAYGWHHRTGCYFQWAPSQPMVDGPEAAPFVTERKFVEFKAAVAEIRPLYSNRIAEQTTIDLSADASADGLRAPRISSKSQWTEDETGKAVDGREKYLWELCKTYMRLNPQAITDLTIRSKVKGHIYKEFRRKAESRGWPDSKLIADIEDKVRRYAENPDYHRGFLVVVSSDKPDQPQVDIVLGRLTVRNSNPDPALGWLSSVRHPLKQAHQSEANPILAAERQLYPGEAREREQTAISRFVKRRIRKYLCRIARLNMNKRLLSEEKDKAERERLDAEIAAISHAIEILKAPTGAGKTVAVLEQVARVNRKLARIGQEIGPMLVFLPNYSNIEEFETKAQALIEELRTMGPKELKVVIFKGMERAGCQQEEKLRLVREARQPASGLCYAKVPVKDQRGDYIIGDDGQRMVEEKFCPFYKDAAGTTICPYQRQKEEIAKSDIVLVPHAYLTVNGFPSVLRQCTGVIIDEKCWQEMIERFILPLDQLFPLRDVPKLTKAMREAEMDAETLLADRDECVEVIRRAVRERQDIIQAFLAYKPQGKPRPVLQLIAGWRYTVDHIKRDGTEITPDTPIERLQEMAKAGSATNLFEERRLAKVIEERISQVLYDKQHGTKTAKGDADARIQILTGHRAVKHGDGYRVGDVVDHIRVAWRKEPNTLGMPTLLLDASASKRIIEKLWPMHTVHEEAIDTQSYLRIVWCPDGTYAGKDLIPAKNSSPQKFEEAGRTLSNVRSMVANVCGIYGYGGVLFGAQKAYEEIVLNGWPGPDNMATCHYGAMRGLDFAKAYSAAISVGRVEAPIFEIDASVAALTYDDDEPETPVDARGNGRARCPMRLRTIKMRDGSDVTILVPEYEGAWARLVQRQLREEELRQFVGRLRPVYREGEPPVWIMLGTCMPENMIVDEVETLQSLAAPTTHDMLMPDDMNAALAARVIAEGITAKACRDVTEKGVARFIKRIENQPLLRKAFTKLPYQIAGMEEWKIAWIPGYVRDPIAAFEKMAAFAGIRVAYDKEDLEECERVDFAVREDDPMIAKVGTIRERMQDQGRLVGDLLQRAGHQWDTKRMKLPLYDGSPEWVTIDQRLAYELLLRKADETTEVIAEAEEEPELDMGEAAVGPPPVTPLVPAAGPRWLPRSP